MLNVISLALAAQMNHLTPAEVKAGWQLLFDGKTTKGWHNYKAKGVAEGWQVRNGVLTIQDPGKAGDIVTDKQYGWFELELDFRIDGKGQNSGIIIHSSETQGEAMWNSGPEIQIYDDHGEENAQKTGFLYELYSSKTDATKPVGQWNHFRIVVAPKKCATYVNGVKYYEYDLQSKEFAEKVAASKFAAYPFFNKFMVGNIGIQGDHGNVSFQNIKIKPIKSSVRIKAKGKK